MKIRNLQKSHDLRQAVKSSGDDAPQRRRIHFATCSVNKKEGKNVSPHVLPLRENVNRKRDECTDVSRTATNNNNTSVDKKIRAVEGEREELRTWVMERRTLRDGKESIGSL